MVGFEHTHDRLVCRLWASMQCACKPHHDIVTCVGCMYQVCGSKRCCTAARFPCCTHFLAQVAVHMLPMGAGTGQSWKVPYGNLGSPKHNPSATADMGTSFVSATATSSCAAVLTSSTAPTSRATTRLLITNFTLSKGPAVVY